MIKQGQLLVLVSHLNPTHTEVASASKMLSTAGARSLINYQNALRATALIFAAGKGHVTVTTMLIEARCNVDLHDKEGFTPLYIAAQEGHAAATKQLI